MTLPNSNLRNDYTAAGDTAVYDYTFRVLSDTHMRVVIHDDVVIQDDVVLVLGVDFTVSGVGEDGGQVTLLDGTGLLVAGVLPVGKSISLIRRVLLVQNTDIKNQGTNWKPKTLEDALDYLTMIDLQQQDSVNRALTILESEPTPTDALVFPSILERANMLLGFDSDGLPIAVSAGGAVSGSWQALIDAMNYVGARNLIGFNGAGATVPTALIEDLAVTTAKLAALGITGAKIAPATITSDKLADGVSGFFPGDLKPSMTTTPGTGWLLCDGAAVSRSTYANLFSAIGETHGNGDGATTFNVPNLKGRSLRGLANYSSPTGSGTAGSNNATFTAHGFTQTGIRVRKIAGTLTGLSAATDYWIIVVDANTLAFGSTRANALAGTKIAISGANSAILEQSEDYDYNTRQAAAPGGGSTLGSYQAETSDTIADHAHSIPAGGSYQTGAGAGTILSNNTGSAGTHIHTKVTPTNIACHYHIKT